MIPSHRSDLPHRPEADQRAFFGTVRGLAATAEARCGAIVRDLVIAGTRIRLVFAGPVLEALLLPAVSHRLAVDIGTPDVTLHVWDSASTGVAMCPPPVEQHCFSERGDIWTFHSARVRSAFHWSEFSLSLLDHDSGEAVFWVRTADGLPYWTQASPFRSLFHWIMAERGAQLIHAAAIGTAAGGVLVTGKGGVGKSTTALACLAAGLRYVGDDYVLLTGGERPAAHSLYRTAKVDTADMPRFERFGPRVLGDAATAGDAKAVIYLDDCVEALPLVAVVTPRFGSGAETGVEPVDPRFADRRRDLHDAGAALPCRAADRRLHRGATGTAAGLPACPRQRHHARARSHCRARRPACRCAREATPSRATDQRRRAGVQRRALPA